MTCDGTATNISTLEYLGCTFTRNYDKMDVSFKHPTRDYPVYTTLDACHMQKLAQNALVTLGVFRTVCEEAVSWGLMKNLSILEDRECFIISNRFNSDHLHWEEH